MSDINNAFETLERSLKKIGIVLIDEQEDIKNGKPSQIIALTRKVLLSTSTAVAKHMLLKGCPSHATDKKLAIAAFDVLRDSKLAPNISIDQFFSQGFVQHKLIILSRLADFVSNTSKSPRPTVMSAFVTEPDIVATSVFSKYYSSSPPKSYVPVDSSESDWPLSDFIRQHIIENKVNTDAMTRKEFKKTILRSRSAANVAAAVAEENKSRINSRNSRDSPVSLQSAKQSNVPQPPFSPMSDEAEGDDQEEMDDEYLNHQIAVDYAYELGRQSPSAARQPVPTTFASTAQSDQQQRQNAYQQQSIKASPAPPAKIVTPRTKYSYANNRDAVASFLDDSPLPEKTPLKGVSAGKNKASGVTGTSNSAAKTSSTVKRVSNTSSVPLSEEIMSPVKDVMTEEQRLEQKAQMEAALTDRIEREVQKRLDAHLEELVDRRVAEAVLEVTQKYDFIINKLVAAVDAEFTLLNNQLRLAGSLNKQPQHY